MSAKKHSEPKAQTGHLEHRDDVPKDFLRHLSINAGALIDADPGLALDVMTHVVDGGAPDVALRLVGNPEAMEAWFPDPSSDQAAWQRWEHALDRHSNMLRSPRPSPEVLLRLSQLLHTVATACLHNSPTMYWHTFGPPWFQTLLGLSRNQDTAWTAADADALLAVGGEPSGLPLRARLGLLNKADPWQLRSIHSMLTEWKPFATSRPDIIVEGFAGAAGVRSTTLAFANSVGLDLHPHLDALVDMATGTSKTNRAEALAALDNHREAARPKLEALLTGGKAGVRREAAGALWRLFGHDAQDVLQRGLDQEASSKNRAILQGFLTLSDDKGDEPCFDLPAVETPTGHLPLGRSLRDALRQRAEETYARARAEYERDLARFKDAKKANPTGYWHEPTKPLAIEGELFDGLVSALEAPGPTEQRRALYYHRRKGYYPPLQHGPLVAAHGGSLAHVVRADRVFGLLRQAEAGHFYWHDEQLEAFRAKTDAPVTLRELAVVLAELDVGSEDLCWYWLGNQGEWAGFADWGDEAIWPLFAENLPVLKKAIGPNLTNLSDKHYDWRTKDKRLAAYRVLKMLPRLTPDLERAVWDVALGETKQARRNAQDALSSVDGKTPRIIEALSDGKQEIRFAAAEWLGRLQDPAAIEPLAKLFKKEKREIVKGAAMQALEDLGADVDGFLDRTALVEEADKGLAKKRPKGSEWIPLDALPEVRWADRDAAVPRAVIAWWILQSITLKAPAPGPLLRGYLARCRREDTAALANFVIEAWIAHDTEPLNPQEAVERAEKETNQLWGYAYIQSQYDNVRERLYQEQLARFSGEPLRSANASKGMLSVAAAAGDAETAKSAERYLRKWFGQRMAQSKAMIEVLAWIDDRTALQALLSIANRFRTKGLQEAAKAHVEQIAERRGWTVDELADRTIPDAGFEVPTDHDDRPTGERGRQVLDYGPRHFTVTLDDELKPRITNQDGKVVKNLPGPGKSDDEAKAKAAKKALSSAKKVTKEVVKQQTQRLYEAMCTQRAWPIEDWQLYLQRHPIVSNLCRRLAWAAYTPTAGGDEPRFLTCFRPLEDGSLTDQEDEEVELPKDAMLRVAHSGNTPEALHAAWAQHFEDYDVCPLFSQFGRKLVQLDEDKLEGTDLRDFEGHMLTTFSLRGKATKLGWARGEAEDGGSFYVYRKSFPSLGVQAVLDFTGSYLPEQDMAAALVGLYFVQMADKRETTFREKRVPLAKVQPVLLSECYHDAEQIAATGSGYDPEWQTKAGF